MKGIKMNYYILDDKDKLQIVGMIKISDFPGAERSRWYVLDNKDELFFEGLVENNIEKLLLVVNAAVFCPIVGGVACP